MTPTLHDLMHDAVREAHPDSSSLAHVARRRGLAIRRRRQALATVGSVAVVAAITLGATYGATQLGGGVSGGPAAGRPTAGAGLTPTAQPTPSAAPVTPRLVPNDGRATTAALLAALNPRLYGAAQNFSGQGSGGGDTFGQLDWHPGNGGGVSVVQVNVQPGFAEREIYSCRDWQVACRVTHPVAGTTLMTYEEHTPTGSGRDGIRVVSDLLRRDGVRVVASATNGFDLPANRWEVTRPRPVLGARQLTEVVSLPTWGSRVDERFAEAGRDLRGYRDLDSEITAPTPTP